MCYEGKKLEKWGVGEICGWWVMSYLLHCSFPIHQNFVLMTDTIGMQNRPQHLSLFNPHHYFLTFVLFHLGTQRVYPHAKGKKTYRFGRDVFVSWEKRGMKKPSRGVVWQTPFFPLTRMRDWECLLNSSTCPCITPFFLSFFLTHSHTHTHPSSLFSPLHAIYLLHTYPLLFSSFFSLFSLSFLTQKVK